MGRVPPHMIKERDHACNVNTAEKREARASLADPDWCKHQKDTCSDWWMSSGEEWVTKMESAKVKEAGGRMGQEAEMKGTQEKGGIPAPSQIAQKREGKGGGARVKEDVQEESEASRALRGQGGVMKGAP